MPPVRTMPATKPVRTERTHEENQERAYIAASRRSDRSLEARVESARRASEIHKRRTGRSLRVTEQDVVNEEMYEEEDDDLPMQYRRLTAHLQTQNADFDRRLAAYLTNHVAMRSALGQAVSDAWQTNQFQQPGQFMNPGMMQMQQPGFQNAMPPPQMLNRSPTTYRQSPYPMSNGQGMRPGVHGRSLSVATPLDMPGFHHQQSQSAQTSPVDTMKPDEKRMSLPAHNMMPQTPTSAQGGQPSNHASPIISRNSSSTNLNPHSFVKTQSPQQQPSPPAQPQPQRMQHSNFPSPFTTSSGFNQAFINGMNFNSPLSATLPMETQQLLGGNPSFDQSDPFALMMMQSQQGFPKPAQPFYSYNPNGKPKNNGGTPPSADGMNTTLAPSMINTDLSTCFTQAAATESAVAPFTPVAYGLGFDCGFGGPGGFDLLNDPSSGVTSGQVTPVEGDWQGLIDANAWEEQPAA